MKTAKIIFWITATIIFLLEGVITTFTSQIQMAEDCISHLDYPGYYANACKN